MRTQQRQVAVAGLQLRSQRPAQQARTPCTSCGRGTVLSLAASEGQEAAVQVLPAAGAYVSKANVDGTTARVVAADRGHLEVVQQLLGAGAGTASIDADDCMALWAAARGGHLEVARQLLELGASPDPRVARATPQ